MVWSRIDKADGKPRYIKKFGNGAFITKSKEGAEDDIPEGMEVVELNTGHLQLRRKR